MNCPNCGAACPELIQFCGNCGSPLPHGEAQDLSDEIVLPAATEEAVPEGSPVIPAEPAPVPEKKGRLWPPAVFLAVMICIGLLVFFLSGDLSGGSTTPWFQVENGVLYFDGSRYSGGSELVIPETVDGQAVIALGDSCFADCDDLTTVILPSALETIGDHAFADCDNLRGIFLPEGVAALGEGAFQGCDSLEAIYIPGTVEQIHDTAFADTPKLRYIIYSGSLEDWQACFSGQLGPETQIHAQDGTLGIPPTP